MLTILLGLRHLFNFLIKKTSFGIYVGQIHKIWRMKSRRIFERSGSGKAKAQKICMVVIEIGSLAKKHHEAEYIVAVKMILIDKNSSLPLSLGVYASLIHP